MPGQPPVWVISKATVGYIPTLFMAYGPGPIEQQLPPSLREPKFWGIALWQWIGIALFAAC